MHKTTWFESKCVSYFLKKKSIKSIIKIINLLLIFTKRKVRLVCAKRDLESFAAPTPFPSVLCAPSRKNALSQGLALIQVKSFQLPALGPSCKCCGGFFAVYLQKSRFSRRRGRRALVPRLRAPTRTYRTQKDSKCMKIEARFCIFVAKRASG